MYHQPADEVGFVRYDRNTFIFLAKNAKLHIRQPKKAL
jgi:hypothetical protein